LFKSSETSDTVMARFLACRLCILAFKESRRSMDIRKDKSTMDNPPTTSKNDSQLCGKPSIGRSAMMKPIVRMILLFGIIVIYISISNYYTYSFVCLREI
jgi:hypothetical protein